MTALAAACLVATTDTPARAEGMQREVDQAAAIAWVPREGRGSVVTLIPTMGARTRRQLADALASLAITLDTSEIATRGRGACEPSRGTRYPEHHMAMLDSERSN